MPVDSLTLPVAQIDVVFVIGAIATILGSGGLAAVLAWRRTGAETESITMATMQAVNQELRTELDRRDRAYAEDLARRDRAYREDLAKRDSEIVGLRERVAILEKCVEQNGPPG